MRRRSFLAGLLTVTLAGAAWVECAGTQMHASAKACCARKHRCTGSKRPDTCCKTMKDGGTASTIAIVSSIHQPASAPPLVAAGLAPGPDSMPLPIVILRDFDFKRPHDPPHLHTFSLLI